MTTWSQQDTIDSTEVIDRIEELVDIIMDDEMNGYLPDADPDDISEFEMLRDLHNEAKMIFDDWEYGETLINESYFADHARELFSEMSDVDLDAWPYRCIDWEQAGDELQSDYTSIEIAGVTFYGRA